jgi:hypothetical protein
MFYHTLMIEEVRSYERSQRPSRQPEGWHSGSRAMLSMRGNVSWRSRPRGRFRARLRRVTIALSIQADGEKMEAS